MTVVRDRQTVTVTVTVGGSQAGIGNCSLAHATGTRARDRKPCNQTATWTRARDQAPELQRGRSSIVSGLDGSL